MMEETLEDLKAIIAGKQDGDMFYDGRYLNSKLYVRHEIKRYHVSGVTENTYYDAPLYVDTERLRSLSDIERQIELLELIGDIRALGFLEESHDSGVSHRNVCKRAKELTV